MKHAKEDALAIQVRKVSRPRCAASSPCKLLAPVLKIINRVIATHLNRQAGVKRSEAHRRPHPHPVLWLGIMIPDVVLLRAYKVVTT